MPEFAPGLVFTIPLSPDRAGVAQIAGVDVYGGYLFCAFDTVLDVSRGREPECPAELVPVLLVTSFDGLLQSGRWKPLGTRPVVPFPEPICKVFAVGGHQIVTWDFKVLRVATPDEIALLPDKAAYSAAILEDALKRYHDRGELPERWEPLTVDHVRACRELCLGEG